MLFWLLFPLVGGLIGWGTNRIAVRLLFRPLEPWRLPYTPWTFQGVLPRRREEIARALGEAVERDLLSREEILRHMASPAVEAHVAEEITQAVVERVSQSLPGWVPAGVTEGLAVYAGRAARQQVHRFFEQGVDNLIERVREEVDLSEMVRRRVESFEMEELEALVLRLASRELRHIELLGGVLGVVVGLVQALVFWLLPV